MASSYKQPLLPTPYENRHIVQPSPTGLQLSKVKGPQRKWADYDTETEDELDSCSASFNSGNYEPSKSSGSIGHQIGEHQAPGSSTGKKLRNKCLPKHLAASSSKISPGLAQHPGDGCPSMSASSTSEGFSATPKDSSDASSMPEGFLVAPQLSTQSTENSLDLSCTPSLSMLEAPLITGAEYSVGSARHDQGECVPCLFARSTRGCQDGAACTFCHLPHVGLGRPGKSKRAKHKNLRKRRNEDSEGIISSSTGSGAHSSAT
jgi:hypothetical protein